MSRTGKKPIQVPLGVRVEVEGQKITAKGLKGESFFVANDEISLNIRDNLVIVEPTNNSKEARSKWGMSRTIVDNLLKGMKDGYERRLEINGVGYRASMVNNNLHLSLGFSHEVLYSPREGIVISVPKPTEIVVSGMSKQQVGQVAAEIRKCREPEPYKGRGIRYSGELIARKEGKKK